MIKQIISEIETKTNSLSFSFSNLQSNTQFMQRLTTKHCTQQATIILQYPAYLTPPSHRNVKFSLHGTKNAVPQNTS